LIFSPQVFLSSQELAILMIHLKPFTHPGVTNWSCLKFPVQHFTASEEIQPI
jgi:hypothetical protein